MKGKYKEQIKEAYNFEKGMIILLVIVLFYILIFKIIPDILNPEPQFEITKEICGYRYHLENDWTSKYCYEQEISESEIGAYLENRELTVNWLNENAECIGINKPCSDLGCSNDGKCSKYQYKNYTLGVLNG